MRTYAHVFLTIAVYAIFGCSGEREIPIASTVAEPFAAGKTNAVIVSTTTITASVSSSNRGSWLTSTGLGIAVAGDLSIDRIGRYNYNGLRIQLSKSGSDGFSDHWNVSDALKMTLTVDGTDVSFSLKSVGGSWAAWTIDSNSQAHIIEGIVTGDSFTLSINDGDTQEEDTDTPRYSGTFGYEAPPCNYPDPGSGERCSDWSNPSKITFNQTGITSGNFQEHEIVLEAFDAANAIWSEYLGGTRLSVTFYAGSGFHATGNMIYLPDRDYEASDVSWLTAVIAHELGHVLGIGIKGTRWQLRRIRIGTNTASYDDFYRFVYGPRAMCVYRGYDPTAAAIPMHMDNMHWEFGGDVMSWNGSDGHVKISDVTVAAILDSNPLLCARNLGESLSASDIPNAVPPPIDESEIASFNFGEDITVDRTNSQRGCGRALADLYSPAQYKNGKFVWDDDFDRDVWDDSYDECFATVLLSGSDDDDNKRYLTDCERLACYRFANCKALGISVCTGPSSR